jgi:hypothetical protein
MVAREGLERISTGFTNDEHRVPVGRSALRFLLLPARLKSRSTADAAGAATKHER